SFNAMNVGNRGSVQGIQGFVDFNNITGILSVFDYSDPVAKKVTVSGSAIDGLGPGLIYWEHSANLNTLDIFGGSGGNTFTVTSTPLPPGEFLTTTTVLNSGQGTDNVTVQGTAGPLFVNGGAGFDKITIGNNGHLDSIYGAVTVSNWSNYSFLTVDGSADTDRENVTITSSQITG